MAHLAHLAHQMPTWAPPWYVSWDGVTVVTYHGYTAANLVPVCPRTGGVTVVTSHGYTAANLVPVCPPQVALQW